MELEEGNSGQYEQGESNYLEQPHRVCQEMLGEKPGSYFKKEKVYLKIYMEPAQLKLKVFVMN